MKANLKAQQKELDENVSFKKRKQPWGPDNIIQNKKKIKNVF